MTLGTRLIQLRLANDFSQEKVGDICGVTKSAVSQWESDSTIPETSKLLLLRERIEFSLDWLLTGESATIMELSKPVRDLLKVAQTLPEYAVINLTRQGDNFTQFINEASPKKTGNGKQ